MKLISKMATTCVWQPFPQKYKIIGSVHNQRQMASKLSRLK